METTIFAFLMTLKDKFWSVDWLTSLHLHERNVNFWSFWSLLKGNRQLILWLTSTCSMNRTGPSVPQSNSILEPNVWFQSTQRRAAWKLRGFNRLYKPMGDKTIFKRCLSWGLATFYVKEPFYHLLPNNWRTAGQWMDVTGRGWMS